MLQKRFARCRLRFTQHSYKVDRHQKFGKNDGGNRNARMGGNAGQTNGTGKIILGVYMHELHADGQQDQQSTPTDKPALRAAVGDC